MKIAVIGAGIVGVTTAYELARDGHAVTVFERRGAAAEETSFANAGIIAPGYVTPWAAPGMPGKVLGQILHRHASIRMAWPLGMDDLRWAWKWYRACQLDTYLSNRAHMRRLAFYSRARLHAIRDDLRLEYDRSDGYLVLLRTDRDLHLVQPSLQVLREAGVAFRVLEPDQARLVEPALESETTFIAGVQLPDDEVGNCRQFALLLKNAAQRIGVQFRFNTAVQSVAAGSQPSVQVQGEPQTTAFDAVVMCAGVASTRLLQPVGITLPLVPVYGYSLSASIKEPLNAPRSAVMDEHYKVAITRMGNRIRVAGGAELGGNANEKRQAPLRTLYKVLQDWFPGAASRSGGIQEWKGARPMLPDGPPLVCASGATGLWLNVGHGSSGWALACGSARALADQIGDRPPDLDMKGFDLARLQR
ncbi:MAG: D-amino acid dehydrogenase [Rhodoferax sp.]|nr:D-amino acid dehydrogenase [Rhodoferax sp.]HQZ08133.1 D-amino acid dehydrogenase [Burkholderiaceae bacterium]